MKQTSPLLTEDDINSSIPLETIDKTLDDNSSSPKSTYKNSHDIKEINNNVVSIKNKLLGVVCCTVCISCWISSAHIIKDIQDDNNDEQYDKPFLLMYAGSCIYIILFIVWYFIKSKSHTSFYKMFKLLLLPAMIVSLLHLFTEFAWALSLNETMVSVNTAIYQSGVALVYVFSIIFLGIKLTWQKIIGVMICIVGVMAISFGAYREEMESEDNVTTNSTKGVIVVIISVFLNSSMMVGIEYVSNKYFDTNHESQDVIFLQGLMGFCILFIYWPLFYIFDVSNVEKFELPSTRHQWIIVLLNMILTICFFGAYFMGIVKTNAIFISVIMLFILPIGYFSDVIIYQYISNVWAYIGTVLIVIGFLMMELPLFDYVKQSCGRK